MGAWVEAPHGLQGVVCWCGLHGTGCRQAGLKSSCEVCTCVCSTSCIYMYSSTESGCKGACVIPDRVMHPIRAMYSCCAGSCFRWSFFVDQLKVYGRLFSLPVLPQLCSLGFAGCLLLALFSSVLLLVRPIGDVDLICPPAWVAAFAYTCFHAVWLHSSYGVLHGHWFCGLGVGSV